LIKALKEAGFEIGVETNGTRLAPEGIDWICVSPKAGADMILREGNELKLVYPQSDLPPELLVDLNFTYFYLQPMDGSQAEENSRAAMRYCMEHPPWRLSVQLHKVWGID
jgi:organic radical activating enzyme